MSAMRESIVTDRLFPFSPSRHSIGEQPTWSAAVLSSRLHTATLTLPTASLAICFNGVAFCASGYASRSFVRADLQGWECSGRKAGLRETLRVEILADSNLEIFADFAQPVGFEDVLDGVRRLQLVASCFELRI